MFKAKRDKDGKVEKARLVAKGFAQKYYDETFSPVVRFSSIRALLAFADMLVHQMDVVTAFLNGNLKAIMVTFSQERKISSASLRNPSMG